MNQMELRRAAAAAGKTRFNTGNPCKRGHFSDRYTANGACVECLSVKTVPQVAISKDLVTWQPQALQIAHDLLPQLRGALDDLISETVEKWHADMGMATPVRVDAWQRLRFARDQKAKLVNYQQVQAAVPSMPIAAKARSERTQRFEGFLAALATMTGAQLDKATVALTREPGEPDNNFRARIKAQTLQNYEAGIG